MHIPDMEVGIAGGGLMDCGIEEMPVAFRFPILPAPSTVV